MEKRILSILIVIIIIAHFIYVSFFAPPDSGGEMSFFAAVFLIGLIIYRLYSKSLHSPLLLERLLFRNENYFDKLAKGTFVAGWLFLGLVPLSTIGTNDDWAAFPPFIAMMLFFVISFVAKVCSVALVLWRRFILYRQSNDESDQTLEDVNKPLTFKKSLSELLKRYIISVIVSFSIGLSLYFILSHIQSDETHNSVSERSENGEVMNDNFPSSESASFTVVDVTPDEVEVRFVPAQSTFRISGSNRLLGVSLKTSQAAFFEHYGYDPVHVEVQQQDSIVCQFDLGFNQLIRLGGKYGESQTELYFDLVKQCGDVFVTAKDYQIVLSSNNLDQQIVDGNRERVVHRFYTDYFKFVNEMSVLLQAIPDGVKSNQYRIKYENPNCEIGSPYELLIHDVETISADCKGFVDHTFDTPGAYTISYIQDDTTLADIEIKIQ